MINGNPDNRYYVFEEIKKKRRDFCLSNVGEPKTVILSEPFYRRLLNETRTESEIEDHLIVTEKCIIKVFDMPIITTKRDGIIEVF